MATVYSLNFSFLLKAVDSTPFHIQAEVTMKTNFFGTQAVCTELLPLIKPQGESDEEPKLQCFWQDLGPACLWSHLQAPLPLLLSSTGLHLCRHPARCPEASGPSTHCPGRWYSVQLLFAHLALSSLSILSSKVSSERPLTCSVPLTAAFP